MEALSALRRPASIALHGALVVAASYGAFWLRFDGKVPDPYLLVWADAVWAVVSIRMLAFFAFRIFDGSWKYTSLWDLRNIVLATLTSSIGIWLCDRLFAWGYPRSIHLLSAVLTVALIAAVRLVARQGRELSWTEGSAQRRVLVYGAGDAGEMIVRDMKLHDGQRALPVGFVDDNSRKVGQRIHGVPVLGGRHQLAEIVARHRPEEVLIAIPSAAPRTLREIVRALEPYRLRITTLPGLRETTDGHAGDVRNLRLDDLLSRAPIGLDPAPLRQLVRGRRVLVTGAGGTIGSELGRQVAAFGPAQLVLLDRYENSLFAVSRLLAVHEFSDSIETVIADVTDTARLDTVFRTYRPEVVFHAAAHKHVQLMEENPCEAVKNNVRGSRLTAQLAARYGVERFILISTDKAVNPASIMGATKRVAELAIREIAATSRTRFRIVRFGNVLGSNGSVVPHFLQQIQRGGPVTVTHPDVRRYFMSIPEAVQLVLHAAPLDDEGGCVYVLEMGDQIKIVDLARSLIRLSGYVPDEDIALSFIGMRPGEKLSEELVGHDELSEPSHVPGIVRVRAAVPHHLNGRLLPTIAELERCAWRGDVDRAMHHICTILPKFTPARVGAAA